MTPADIDPLVPDRVVRVLESGKEEAAGELLREHAEALARTSPGRGRRWSRRAAAASFDRPLFGGFVQWSAGAVYHLVGETDLAEAELERASRTMARAGRRDLADRVGLLLVDVYGEQLRLPRARVTARRLERRFAERGDDERSAVALANLGCAEDAADRVERARALWRQALRRLPAGGLRHLLARANLANSAALMGRFGEGCRGR